MSGGRSGGSNDSGRDDEGGSDDPSQRYVPWLIYGAIFIVVYNLARREHISKFAAILLASLAGAVYLLNKIAYMEIDTREYGYHIAIIITGVLLIGYLWSHIINDVDE